MKIAIIPARGGSKGIPKKNIMDFCGKPLIAWSIEQAIKSKLIDDVYVSSDCNEILEVAKKYGAKTIIRPDDISDDLANSESTWLHAFEHLEELGIQVNLMIGMQATSPIRESSDLDKAIKKYTENNIDSLFSATPLEDFFMWEHRKNKLESINYDFKKRKRRQDIGKQYLENGSFYLFNKQGLSTTNNRLYGIIDVIEMEFWKSFEIDSLDDVKFLETIMKSYILGD